MPELVSGWNLTISSPSLDGLDKAITEYYYGSEKKLVKVNDKLYDVFGAKGKMKHARVVKKGKRWRYEILL